VLRKSFIDTVKSNREISRIKNNGPTIKTYLTGVFFVKHGKLMDTINEIIYYTISKMLTAIKYVADDTFI